MAVRQLLLDMYLESQQLMIWDYFCEHVGLIWGIVARRLGLLGFPRKLEFKLYMLDCERGT